MAKINKNQKLLDWYFPSTNDGPYGILSGGSLIPFKTRGKTNGKANKQTKTKTT